MEVEEAVIFLRMVGCFIVRLHFGVGRWGGLWHVRFFQPNRGGVQMDPFDSLSCRFPIGCGNGDLSAYRRLSHRQVWPEKRYLLQHLAVWNRPSLT